MAWDDFEKRFVEGTRIALDRVTCGCSQEIIPGNGYGFFVLLSDIMNYITSFVLITEH